jgi:hypothetical protein
MTHKKTYRNLKKIREKNRPKKIQKKNNEIERNLLYKLFITRIEKNYGEEEM